MHSDLHVHPDADCVTGPAGSLRLLASDWMARRFLMLLEGECFHQNVTEVAAKYGYSRQRYYQLLQAYQAAGIDALEKQKTGPKTNYRRTEQTVRQVLRYLFLDPEASPEVVTQKLRQDGYALSLRSVQRIIADYGLQKKTLRAQPEKLAALAHAARGLAGSHRPRRSPQHRTGNPPGAGR